MQQNTNMGYRNIFTTVLLFTCFAMSAQTGIGTTAPINKLEVVTATADPATSGATANGNLRIGPSTGSHVLDFGLSSSSTYSWLQARSKSAYGTTYNLVLNPIGGNVGIGTTNPTAKLNLVGGGIRIFSGFTDNSAVRPAPNTSTIGNYEIRGVGGGGGATQADGGDDGFLRLSAGGGSSTAMQSSIDLSGYSNVADMLNNIVMRTAGTERLRIDNLGNVGIGTSAPSVRLQVAGDIIANSIAGSSDLRFKTNITPIENPLQKVLKLRGVNFDWNKNAFPERSFSESKAIGFIAQEVEKVLPEVVQTEKTAEGYKAVQYDKVVALLVEAIKEQQKQIDGLKLELKNQRKKKK
jgi:Chaperone of endosialidase